jgi:ribosomal protein S13
MLLDAALVVPALAGLRVTDALGALPGVGPKGVERIMAECGIATSRRLRGLGQRQREALVARTWGRRGTA